jgi:serine/threonine protein kinase
LTVRTIGKYELLEELGRGGFAVVYRARDIDLDRVVALKVLHPHWIADPQFVTRFRQEARAAANLQHPNIVTILESGEADGQLYIAMEYLPGHTLHDLLEEQGALSLEAALPILEQLADTLDYAHSQGVIHRDIKPANVMVKDTTSDPHITLMDFGLVKAMEGSLALTVSGALLGSPEYMAPEQADLARKDEIGSATDRYALGIVAYQLLTGRVPFPGSTPATLYAHVHTPPPDPCALLRDSCPDADLPEDVATVLLTVLAKAPADRFPTASEFVARLREIHHLQQQQQARANQLAELYRQFQIAI